MLPASSPHLSSRFVRRFTIAAAVASSALLTACSGADKNAVEGGDTGGTLVIVTPAEPTTLFPPQIGSTQGFAVATALFDYLAALGPSLETVGDKSFEPQLASSWEWASDSLSIAFTMDSLARWHDGQPVRAADVAYTFRAYTDDSVAFEARALLGNIDSVTARDARTAVFWFKRRMPQQFYDATSQMLVLPSHLLDTIPMSRVGQSAFARQPVGTGRFRFVKWEPRQRLEMVADTANARGRARLDRVIWSFAPDLGAATVKLFSGEADFLENVPPDQVTQVSQSGTLRLLLHPALQYNFLGFNARDPRDNRKPHPVFGDSLVRRALTMAVDRERLVRNVLDSLGATGMGPAPRALIPDTAAVAQIPYNPEGARALLDSAGWVDSNNDAVRERNGVPLAFEMLAPSSSVTRQRFTVLMQEQLRAVGVRATPVLLEVNALNERIPAKDFDSYLGGWLTSPGLGGVRQSWMSTGESNVISYQSPTFDAFADSALSTFNPDQARSYWTHAFQQAVNDAPALWLYEQRIPMALHKRVIVPPLRVDGWWTNLADWRIDPAQRIDRDRIGLGTPPEAKR